MAIKETPKAPTQRGVWREYTDGDWWKLERGTDWTGPVAQSRAMTARDWAKSNGYRLQTSTDGPDVLYVRFTSKND